MRLGTALILAAAGAGLWAGAPARAADLPLYGATGYAQPEPQLEFGTGWYLRGDAAFGEETAPKLRLAPAAPSFDPRATRFGYAFGGGIGYKFTDSFRVDVTGDVLDPFRYSATLACGQDCSLNGRSEVGRYDGLVNGYYEVGTWAGLTPYLGFGVGLGATHTREASTVLAPLPAANYVDPRTGAQLGPGSAASRTDLRFAWAAMAGVSYAVSPHLLLDLGYRYLDLGRTTVATPTVPAVRRDLSGSQVRVGVRYVVD